MHPLLLALGLLACKPDAAATPAAPTEGAAAAAAAAPALRTAPAEPFQYSPRVELTGTLSPMASVQLGFDVPGRIRSLHVKRGDQVKPGDVLARLDARMASAQEEQAEAARAGAAAQLAAGVEALGRLQQLRDAGGVSEQQYQDAAAAVKAGQAGVAQADAAVRLARAHVSNHALKAPIEGTVTNGPDNAGAMVGAGTPLFVIEDLRGLVLKATAPESASWIAAGLGAEILVPGGASVPATVERVIPSLDPQTRRIPVELRVWTPPPSLRANAFARAVVRGASDIPAYKVPGAAVVARPGYCVYVQENGALRRVAVEVLERTDDTVVIRAELPSGAAVVLDPPKEADE